MKSVITALLLCFALNTMVGQSLSVNYNSVHIGRNVSALFHTKGEKDQFYFGIKFHINHVTTSSAVFFKKFHASDFAERVGLQLGYNRLIPINDRNRFILFYDNQFSVLGTKGNFLNPVETNASGAVLFDEITTETDQLKAVEQIIGIGLAAGLGDKLDLMFKAGVGGSLFWDQLDTPFTDSMSFEGSYMFSVGAVYGINKTGR